MKLSGLSLRQKDAVLLLASLISIFAPASYIGTSAQPVDFDVIEKNSGSDFLQGYKLRRQGKLEDALTAFSKSISNHPENTETYLERADLLIQLKKYRDALSDLNKYASMLQQTSDKDDKSRQAIIARYKALAFDGLGNPNEALRNFKESLDLDDTIYTRVELGNYYKRHGDRTEALSQFQNAKSRMHGGGWHANWGQFEVDLDKNMSELSGSASSKNIKVPRKQNADQNKAKK
jgi:tetratricopeptide (TPR) repeat protein